MKEVQKYISLAVSENSFSHYFTHFTSNVDGQYFGKILPTIASIEYPFLKFVKDISKTKTPITLELGAGMGLVL